MKDDPRSEVRHLARGGVAALALLLACAPAAVAPPSPADRPQGVILVSLDTCRRDHLGLYGYERPTSPNLDRLGRDSAVFDNAFVQSNETVFSHASLLTSRYPREIGDVEFGFQIAPSLPSLAEVFRENGYATAAFVAGGQLKRYFGFDRGFDVFEDRWDFGSFFHTEPPALAWLDAHASQPFFLLLHGYDCHSSYVKPLFFDHLYDPGYDGEMAELVADDPVGIDHLYRNRYFPRIPDSANYGNGKGKSSPGDEFFQSFLPNAEANGVHAIALTDADLKHLVAHYDGGITYVDLFLGLLLAHLQQRGLLDQVVLAVIADHGEDLGDHGYFHHRPVLYDSTIRVPFILRAPAVAQSRGRRFGELVEMVDLMPTLLDLAGVPIPEHLEGRSVAGLLSGQRRPPRARAFAFAESRAHFAVRSPDALLVARRNVDGTLRDGALEYFQIDGAHEVRGDPASPKAAAMRQALSDWLERTRRE